MKNWKNWAIGLMFVVALGFLAYGVSWLKTNSEAKMTKPKPPAKVMVVDSTGKAVEPPPALQK